MQLSSLLAVFGHPDDESLAAGGTLAQHAEAGARTGVVTATWLPRHNERPSSLMRCYFWAQVSRGCSATPTRGSQNPLLVVPAGSTHRSTKPYDGSSCISASSVPKPW